MALFYTLLLLCTLTLTPIIHAAEEEETAAAPPTTPTPYPYHVLIRFQKTPFSPPQYCSGAIVAKTWVLTAAHCVYNDFMHPDNFTVYSGLSEYPGDAELQDSDSTNGKAVTEVITHFNHNPFFDQDLNWDYALIKTFTDFEDSEIVPIVGRYFMPTGYATATGFGLRDSTSDSKRLQKSSIDVIGSENCQAYHTYIQSRSNFCGGAFANCQLDIGSPLVQNGLLIGIFIHSHSRNCKRKQPGVYADVSTVQDWIDDVISKFEVQNEVVENVHTVQDSLEEYSISDLN